MIKKADLKKENELLTDRILILRRDVEVLKYSLAFNSSSNDIQQLRIKSLECTCKSLIDNIQLLLKHFGLQIVTIPATEETKSVVELRGVQNKKK